MLDATARERINFHLEKAIVAQEALTDRLRRAQDSFASYNALARELLPMELVEGSKAAYNVAYHIDRAWDAWEIADR